MLSTLHPWCHVDRGHVVSPRVSGTFCGPYNLVIRLNTRFLAYNSYVYVVRPILSSQTVGLVTQHVLFFACLCGLEIGCGAASSAFWFLWDGSLLLPPAPESAMTAVLWLGLDPERVTLGSIYNVLNSYISVGWDPADPPLRPGLCWVSELLLLPDVDRIALQTPLTRLWKGILSDDKRNPNA